MSSLVSPLLWWKFAETAFGMRSCPVTLWAWVSSSLALLQVEEPFQRGMALPGSHSGGGLRDQGVKQGCIDLGCSDEDFLAPSSALGVFTSITHSQ